MVQLIVISVLLWGQVWVEAMFDGCRCAFVERVSVPSLRVEVLGVASRCGGAMPACGGCRPPVAGVS